MNSLGIHIVEVGQKQVFYGGVVRIFQIALGSFIHIHEQAEGWDVRVFVEACQFIQAADVWEVAAYGAVAVMAIKDEHSRNCHAFEDCLIQNRETIFAITNNTISC